MAQPTLRRANPDTIQDKLLVGYQGWFTCAGDGPPIHPGHHGWLHWFNLPIPSGGRPNTDLWPDTSEYDPSELYPAPGLTMPSGDPVYLFSSRNPKTVRRHFHWMALHGVDGAFLQRFAGQCEIKPGNIGVRDLRDEVGERVREAAEAEGRVFAIMYDVSGQPADKIQNILEQDWAHLLADQHVLDSPNYLRENGRPVVALWGFGFNGRNHTPDLVRNIVKFFRSNTPGGVYLLAGTPGHWRTSTSDADRNKEFVQVWTECFDAISPWTVGRYGNEEEAGRWGEERVKADAEYLNKLGAQGGRKVDYMPVVLPGGSGFNLSGGKWPMNDIRRNGGKFLWRQIYNARRAGVRIIYAAMWDEYDEGTVFMPVVSHASQVPVHPAFRFIALDVDGQDLPSDWYMRIAGFAAEVLHGERPLPDTLPYKELQDYWSTRPHYERTDNASRIGRADIDDVTRTFGNWQVSGGHTRAPTEPPPPYSLEDAPAHQGLQAPLSGAGRTGRPPPVPQSTRPSSLSISAAAAGATVPLAAAAVAHTLSEGSASGPGRTPLLPPPVDLHSRPSPATAQTPGSPSSRPYSPPSRPPPSTRPYSPPSGPSTRPSSTLPFSPPSGPPPSSTRPFSPPSGPPPPSTRPYSPPSGPPPPPLMRPFPPPGPPLPQAGPFPSPPGPPPPGPFPPPPHARHGSSFGPVPPPRPGPGVPAPYSGEYAEYKRGRSRSRSGSCERSKSGRRSSSSSSSKSRKHGRATHAHGHGHGHSQSLSPAPVGSPSHGTAFPAPGGLSHAYSEGGYPGHGHGFGHEHGQGYGQGQGHGYGPVRHGSYTPVHSAPVGQPDHAPYAPYAPYGSGGSYSDSNPSVPHGGYGASAGNRPGYGGDLYANVGGGGYGGQTQGVGNGQGFGQGTPQYLPPPQHPSQSSGYGPYPSSSSASSSSYSTPYGPDPPSPAPAGGSASAGASGSGTGSGGKQGGIASALHAVEGIAGKQTRKQLEKTVQSLSNTFNKFKP